MTVCEQHTHEALKILNAPHIKKSAEGTTCVLCKQPATYTFFYSNKPIRLREFRTMMQTS